MTRPLWSGSGHETSGVLGGQKCVPVSDYMADITTDIGQERIVCGNPRQL